MRLLRYDWAGVALGVALPVVATLIAAWTRHGSVGIAALGAVQASEPLLWLMDTAPVVVGVAGWAIERQQRVVTAQQARINRLELQRRRSLDRSAVELSGTALNLLARVSSLGAASAQMTASVRGAIETMTALSHGATAAALAAETVAARALDAAAKESASADELAATLRGAASSAKEIATFAQEQMDGIDRVLAAMNEIHFATETSTESAHEIAAEARALARRAKSLRDGVGSRGEAAEEQIERTEEQVERPEADAPFAVAPSGDPAATSAEQRAATPVDQVALTPAPQRAVA
ncbi:MAG TPA: hypothetical protein VFK85_15505 [Anaeromyxobacteraceae bacterium]|nr:hypothetical protein [Anaeromyxobacteraceae bacterium]